MIREARHVLEAIRGDAGELEVARATAEGDLSHLAQTCADTVQMSLDAVLADVEQMERAGEATPDAAAITAEDGIPRPRTNRDSGFGNRDSMMTLSSRIPNPESRIPAR